MSIVDFHSHLIPGVDDGAVDETESVAALCALAEQGVSVAVATPHLDASITAEPLRLERRLDEIDRGWRLLCDAAHDAGVPVRLHRGVELNLDTPDPVLDDTRLRLAGGRFVLMEFPYMAVPPNAARVVRQLRDSGVVPIVAHPERYQNLDARLRLVGEWRDAGAYLQVNGGSLLGRYGRLARQRAAVLLERGWVDYLSSDFHARGDPQVRDYERILVEAGAEDQVDLLMRTNPARLLEGHAPLPVAPHAVAETFANRLRALINRAGAPVTHALFGRPGSRGQGRP